MNETYTTLIGASTPTVSLPGGISDGPFGFWEAAVQHVEELMVQFIGGVPAATVADHANRESKYVGVVGIVRCFFAAMLRKKDDGGSDVSGR